MKAPSRRASILAAVAVLAALLLALGLRGCRHDNPAPHRVDTPATWPKVASVVTVPISAKLSDLEAGLNAQVPRTLWTIDKVERNCVPAQKVSICPFRKKNGDCGFGIKKLKVTPTLSCRIVGQVDRGRIALSGHGDTLLVKLPVNATISAQDIGHIIKRETATGSAAVDATVKLSVRRDWTPEAKTAIRYDWTEPPGVTLLGKRITFVDKADAKLAGVLAKLQRQLPQEIAKLNARDKVEAAWRSAFTSIMLNRDKPPVWLRITPEQLAFRGYRIDGGRLALTAAASAVTETFVGNRPPDPKPGPLPPLGREVGAPALAFQMPVLADYRELEPVLQRALRKLNAKGIVLPKLGPVDVDFGRVTIYATDGNRLAVGVDARAKLRSGSLGIGTTNGQVWLTATPWNADNSEVVEFRDLAAASRTDSHTVDLLLAVFQAPATLDTIRGALTQNFTKDYTKVLASARKAIAERRQGDFLLSASIDTVTHGRIVPTGSGLFLPVRAEGQAAIRYVPRR